MHILEIPSFFPPYGGLFCLEQAKALALLGHEVRILSNVQLGMTSGLRDYLFLPYFRHEHEMGGLTVCQSYQRGIPKAVRCNFRRWVHGVQSMFEDYVAQYGKPDVLHAHCCKWAGYAAMKISRQYGIPYVITEHLSRLLLQGELGNPSSGSWQVPLLRQAYEMADRVIPVSEELVGELAPYFGKDYRWQAVSNIVDVEFFHAQTRPSPSGRTFRFCCLANYTSLKGYEVLFAAYKKLRQQGLDVALSIAGKGTDSAACTSQLSEGIQAYGLLDRQGIRQFLYDQDCMVLASRSETQGLVLLEALSTGIPVVSTDAIPASVRPKEGCMFVPVDDVDALSEAMKQMMHTTFDTQRLHQQVVELASPLVVGRSLEQIFTEVRASH